MVDIREIRAKTILRKQRRVDSWFVSAAGMNLYRGCAHDCAYCDGRAEKYRVQGEFGREVAAKVNAAEVLRRELDPRRKRVPLRRAYLLLGGGVGDSYQPAEERYGLARQALEAIEERGLPVHVLTKSSLVERDFDVLGRIAERARAILSVSLSTADDDLARTFEPGCSPPSQRLETLRRAREHGLHSGVYLMPVIPLVSDAPGAIDDTLGAIADAGADFAIFGGMTLKPGRQTDHFLDVLGRSFPDLVQGYERLYPGDRWGNARGDYYSALNQRFRRAARRRGIPRRMPLRLYTDVLDEDDRVVVALEHLDYLCRLEDKPAPYRRAARAVAELDRPVAELRDDLQSLPGVGRFTAKLIGEILDTGGCAFLDELL